MKGQKLVKFVALSSALTLLASCASFEQPGNKPLTEDQIIHMMGHPKIWDGRTFYVTIYPYDNGFGSSYRVCFEQCDGEYADSSPFVIYTKERRFADMKGQEPFLVHVSYSAKCALGTSICPDLIVGQFSELD